MNTLEFLEAVLPPTGVYYLALIDRATGRVAHKHYTNLQEMADGVLSYDDSGKYNVYHACSSYKEPMMIGEDGKKKFRTNLNWDRAKALWIDLDCGEDKAQKGEGYLTKKDAATAITKFCTENNFPKPMFVDSGNGVHCYWPFTKAIKAEAWVKLANVFKYVLAHYGVLADPTCTADFARILRPVNSTNRKKDTKPVVGKKLVDPVDPAVISTVLSALVKANEIKVSSVSKAPVADINDDLTAHLPPSIPCYAELVADRCAQVASMRDTQGDVSYEHWRHVIGIIKHCEEGIDLAYKWSEKRAETGHSQNDTDVRYNTWATGPSLCSTFSVINPKGCEGCPNKGKINTPIVLGRMAPETKMETVEAKENGQKIEVQIPEFPKNYGHENGRMVRYMKDKDNIIHSFEFCTNIFYPVYRIRTEDGTYALSMRTHLPDGRIRDFEIPTKLIASPQKCLESLADYEVISTNQKDASMHLTAYLKESLEKLKSEAEEINTLTEFGWHNDMQTFLIGDRLYHKDGTIRKVLLGGYAKTYVDSFPSPVGTVEGYAEGLNFLYNRSGMGMMQYVVGSSFGSLLTPFSDSMYKGLIVALIGGKTAKGKTTVCWASLYAFGNADKMTISTEKGSTENARNAQIGTYKNIPLLIDELTNIDKDEFSRMAYYISGGKEKNRLVSNGTKGFAPSNGANWSMSPLVTANTDLHGLLASQKGNTEAEAVRLIQIDIDLYKIPLLESSSEVELAKKQMELNMGSAGDLYIKYIVTNTDDVINKMKKWGRKVESDISDIKYRLYRQHAICSFTALEITNQLGITQFNLEALYPLVIDLINTLAKNIQEQNVMTPEDALSELINAMSPRIISTYGYTDSRGGNTVEQIRTPIGGAIGRYIIGSQHDKSAESKRLAGKLFLARREAIEWTKGKRLNFTEMERYALDNRIMIPMDKKFTIGKGTTVQTGNINVVCIDMDKLTSMTGNNVFLNVHTKETSEDLKKAV
jgi:hypothetical protein